MNLLVEVLYLFFRILGAIVFFVPAFLKSTMTYLASLFIFHILPFRKKIILHNLALCFPRKSEESMSHYRIRCEKIARKNYQHYLLMVLEILERFHWTPQTVFERCKSTNAELLHRLTREKVGYFFLTSHLGNWELLTLYGVAQKVPLTIITRFLRSGVWDKIWVKSREAFGLQLLNESGSGLAVIRAIRREDRAVGFIMDQHTGIPHGIKHQFFGVSAWCPKGLAILSIKLECPVVPAYMIRTKPGYFHVTIEEPLNFPKHLERNTDDAAVIEHIKICNNNMERWIERYPDQYLWLHKRFKETFDYSAPLPWA
jgi:KDO2-lipid IV(A) lauroyltransferase